MSLTGIDPGTLSPLGSALATEPNQGGLVFFPSHRWLGSGMGSEQNYPPTPGGCGSGRKTLCSRQQSKPITVCVFSILHSKH